MTRKQDTRSERAQLKLLEAMEQGRTFTWWGACDFLHLTRNNNNKRHLRALHANGKIHISTWEKMPSCHPVPVFAIGKGKDAPRPEKLTRYQINKEAIQRHREKIGNDVWSAVRRARSSGATALVVSGKPVWRLGQGINIEAARAAFGG